MRVKIKDEFIVNALDGFRSYAHGRGAIIPKKLTLFKISKVVVCNNKLSDEACAGEYFIAVSEDAVCYWLNSDYDNDPDNCKTYFVYRDKEVKN